MRRLALATTLVTTLLCATWIVAAAVAVAQAEAGIVAQPKLEFRLGFKTLAEAIPQVVGQPVEEEQLVEGGWTLQQTTGGLMVWREVDNWTGFTDGTTTWALGPFGLQERSNGERFDWESRPSLTFADPIAYCAAVGTLDRPDSRYIGLPVPQVVKEGLATVFGRPAVNLPERGIFLRCLEGKLLACSVGANLNCGKANTSRDPNPGMVKYCQDNPESSFIPLAVVGHEGIYAWRCTQGEPAIERRTFQVDPRGFVAELWHEILPLPGK